jgi:chromosome partitioning protein
MKSPDPTVITVANLTGGVGKTTTAVCLASGLALKGRRTVLVDMDTHCSATAHFLDLQTLAAPGTIADVIKGGVGLMEALIPTRVEGLGVVTAGETGELGALWAGRSGDGELALRKALGSLGPHPPAYIVIDTPPSIDAFTVNAIAASDWIIVPVTCEYLPLLGLRKFNKVLAGIRERLAVRPDILGYLMTMVDRRERITWEVEEILKKAFGSMLFRTVIRIDTKIKSCPSHRRTIYEYEPEDGRARSDFEQLVGEVIERIESRSEHGHL